MNKKLLTASMAILIALLLSISLKSDSYAELTKIPANPEKGFSWPYYLSIPSAASYTLLVIPNNTGARGDDPAIADEAARIDAIDWSGFAGEIQSPLLIPTFPRPYTIWWIYTQALDRDTLLTDIEGLRRIDLQLLAMIDDARDRLLSMGIYVEKKVLVMGFSASGMFTNRFSAIHPERIRAAAIGSPGGWPLAPVSQYNSEPLRYNVGIYDLKDLIGEAFDLEKYKHIPFYFFMGDQDTNDSVPYADSYETQDAELVNRLFGNTPVARWPKAKEIYDSVGCDSKFVLYAGVAHAFTSQMQNDVKTFFTQSKTIEPDISVDPSSYNFGDVKVRGFSETLFKITNDGNAILHVDSTAIVGDTDQFYITDGDGFFSLVPGQSRDVRVKFSPSSPGRKMATLRLLCDDPDDLQLDLNLMGNGKASTSPAIPLLLLND